MSLWQQSWHRFHRSPKMTFAVDGTKLLAEQVPTSRLWSSQWSKIAVEDLWSHAASLSYPSSPCSSLCCPSQGFSLSRRYFNVEVLSRPPQAQRNSPKASGTCLSAKKHQKTLGFNMFRPRKSFKKSNFPQFQEAVLPSAPCPRCPCSPLACCSEAVRMSRKKSWRRWHGMNNGIFGYSNGIFILVQTNWIKLEYIIGILVNKTNCWYTMGTNQL